MEDSTTSGKKQLVEYVQYLMGAIADKEFNFNADDYSQKQELNTKSLLHTFNTYANQEENAMKTVANDIIERIDNKNISDRFSYPISAEVYDRNPKY